MPKVVFFDLDGTLYDNRWMKILMPLGAFRSRRPLRNLRLMAAERSCRRSIARGPQGLAGYDTLCFTVHDYEVQHLVARI